MSQSIADARKIERDLELARAHHLARLQPEPPLRPDPVDMRRLSTSRVPRRRMFGRVLAFSFRR